MADPIAALVGEEDRLPLRPAPVQVVHPLQSGLSVSWGIQFRCCTHCSLACGCLGVSSSGVAPTAVWPVGVLGYPVQVVYPLPSGLTVSWDIQFRCCTHCSLAWRYLGVSSSGGVAPTAVWPDGILGYPVQVLHPLQSGLTVSWGIQYRWCCTHCSLAWLYIGVSSSGGAPTAVRPDGVLGYPVQVVYPLQSGLSVLWNPLSASRNHVHTFSLTRSTCVAVSQVWCFFLFCWA